MDLDPDRVGVAALPSGKVQTHMRALGSRGMVWLPPLVPQGPTHGQHATPLTTDQI
jgi:hypothetical protein